MVQPLLEDEDASTRHAAVVAVHALGNIDPGASEQSQRVRARARELLQARLECNQGRGDENNAVRLAAERLAKDMHKTHKALYTVVRAKEVFNHTCTYI
jgi:hypothetical protein